MARRVRWVLDVGAAAAEGLSGCNSGLFGTNVDENGEELEAVNLCFLVPQGSVSRKADLS